MPETQAARDRRAVLATAFAAFVAFTGIGVVDPILPVIAHAMGALPWQVELLFTSYIAVMAVAMLLAGVLATRLCSKRMLVLGLAIVVVFATLSGLSGGIGPLALARAGWGLGNAFFTSTALAIIVGLSGGNLARAIPLYEAALGLGIATGPLIGGVLGSASWRYPFFGTATLMAIALLCALTLVPEPSRRESPRGVRDLFRALHHPAVLTVALSGLCYSFCFFVILAYSPLLLDLPALHLGLIFFAWGVLVGWSSVFLVAWLERRWRPVPLIMATSAVLLADALAIALVPNPAARIALIIFTGVCCGTNNALFTTLAIAASPFTRSISSGAYNFLRWSGAALAPVLSGVIAHAVAPAAPFFLAAATLAAGLAILHLRGGYIDAALGHPAPARADPLDAAAAS